MGRLFWLLLLVAVSEGARRRLKDPAIYRSQHEKQKDLEKLVTITGNCSDSSVISYNGVNTTFPWKTYFFNARIDHFSYRDSSTYKMRYFVNNCYYKKGGPIFLYTGNEGDLVDFALNTGMIWDLAPQFNAAVIFTEHRFYGQSQPFGADSYKSLKNLGYLTSEQALADYADFLIQIKTDNNGMDVHYDGTTKVIAFGGSYGGMLAAWMRMKYPHLITGSWASSAPLLYVKNGGVPVGTFDSITKRTFMDAGCNQYMLDNWWPAILNLSATQAGCDWINTNMNIDNRTLVKNQTDGWNLIYYIREGLEYMAMVDYPYPSSFLTPMPGFPVTVASQYLNTPGGAGTFNDTQLAFAAYQASQVYYNWNGNGVPYCIDGSICGDPATAGLGDDMGWPWQECSEIVMMMCSQGEPNDFFWNECVDSHNHTLEQILAEQCGEMFGTLGWDSTIWNVRGVETRFGLSLLGHSRLILTQGYLDPWSGGGFTPASPGASPSNGIYITTIQGSAHHLDLRTPNNCDPNTISYMRFQIVNILMGWLQDTNMPLYNLPAWNKVAYNDSQCADVNFGYPWGQSYPSNPTQNPTNPPTVSTNPPTVPTNPPTVPTNPPTVPTNPPTVPTNPPTVPTNPPTVPTNPPTTPKSSPGLVGLPVAAFLLRMLL